MRIEVIAKELPEDVKQMALDFAKERAQIKEYLRRHNMCYDKFTVTKNDAFLGYISEKYVSDYIRRKYGKYGIKVDNWGDQFDMSRIYSIVASDSADPEDLRYVKKYFYDCYDLHIYSENKEIFADVKTAETENSPQNGWKFLYPVVQSQRQGKEYAILAYYRKKSKDTMDFQEMDLCGYMSEEDIKEYPIQQRGTRTIHNTFSQIENYCTNVSGYKNLDLLIQSLLEEI